MGNCRVLIDGYFYGKPYGFGRFIYELCRALERAPNDLEIVVAVPNSVDEKFLGYHKRITWHRLPKVNFILWEQIMIPMLGRRLSCDVIHFPYNTRAFYSFRARTVTTVHDVIFLSQSLASGNAKHFLYTKYTKFVFNHSTKRSNAVVSVSEATRKCLMALGLQSRTVYNTVDGFIAESTTGCRKTAGRSYILHRGGYLPHRNTERVLDAFRNERGALSDIDLKIVGAPLGASKWNTSGDSSIQFLPRVSNQELAALYAGSICVVAPSLQEGFCLPIIEGFGFEVPVITSKVDPMREIAGGAALLVDPFSVVEIRKAMITIVSDRDFADSLVRKGRTRLTAFASEQVADQMVEIYRYCASSR
jgi:glycosyltransferase involved in cell wall biosynthesis